MSARRLRIRIATQELELLEGSRLLSRYPVSTAAKGAGERIGSEQTPRGAHEIVDLIGAGEPVAAVFVGRQPTGEICTPELRAARPERDWILSRVIWLGGTEDGANRGGDVDTLSRDVYIHGTPDSEGIGVPRSHGCIRMRNEDIVELFDLLETGMAVQIDE